MEGITTAPIDQVLTVRAQLLEAMNEPPEHEEIARLDANYGLQREAFLELLQGEETGNYDEDSVDASVVQAIDDHATNQLEIFDMEMEVEIEPEGEEEQEEAEMSSPIQYASFSSAHGEVLAGLIEREYENADDGIADVAAAVGATPTDIHALIRGQIAFSPDTNIAIANVFDTLVQNPQAHNEFVQLGTQAYNEIVAQSTPAQATMSSGIDHQLRAEFALSQEEKAIAQSLKDLERRANAAYDAQIIKPREHYLLVGGLIEDREDRVAAFSAFCDKTQTDPSLYIYGANFALNLLEQRGPVMEFSEMTDSSPLADIAPEDLQFAQEFVNRNGYE